MPAEKKIPPVNALSIDVEDYFHVSAFELTINRNRWNDYAGRVAQNTERILNILAEKNIKATFFILGWVAKRHPEIVRTIKSLGHEIAAHGYNHELITKQTPGLFRKDLKESIDVLQDITGDKILGYRAPSFSVTPKTLWSIDIMIEMGLKYDSSVFPAMRDYGGYPGAPQIPYKIKNDFWEFPLSTYKFLGLSIPVAGGGYFRLFPYGLTRHLLREKNKQGLPFVFYLHPWELDSSQPRIKEASFFSRFRHYQNLEKTEPRFRNLCRDFAFGPIKDALDILASPKG